MSLQIPELVLSDIHSHVESRYPEEAAGLILGRLAGEDRIAHSVLPLENQFEDSQRGHRYRIEPRELLQAEKRAEQLGVDIIGVFHSHPDHPAKPSQYDLEWAVPWYIYLITGVRNGRADASTAWRLHDDHSEMLEEPLQIVKETA